MEFKSLSCPNCNASLKIEDGVDSFLCKHCGYKILVDGQSKAAYNAKVRIKKMEHKERLQAKHYEQERYKKELKLKEDKQTVAIVLGIFGVIVVFCLILWVIGCTAVNNQESELQDIVDQIMVDIENEDFADAYIKANSLHWDDSWSSEGEDKWDAIREEVIKQIEEAEKTAARENFFKLVEEGRKKAEADNSFEFEN